MSGAGDDYIDLPAPAEQRVTEPIPARIAALPRDPARKNIPIPWFVHTINGRPDFRILRPTAIADAVRRKLCWICGQRLGSNMSFVIGPMCTVNRTSAEPPSHRDCAEYAARVCPFLARPNMRRQEHNIPEQAVEAAGIMLPHNPGACAVWTTRSYQTMRVDNGVLFTMGEPEEVEWYREGRPASRDEVAAAMERGLPALMQLAEAEGPGAVADLTRALTRAVKHMPASASAA